MSDIPTPSAVDQLLCQREVAALLGVSRCQVWRLRRDTDFPRPILLTPSIQRWSRIDLLDWARSRKR